MNPEDALAFNTMYSITTKRLCQPDFCNFFYKLAIPLAFLLTNLKKQYIINAEMGKDVHFRIGQVSCTKMSVFAFCFISKKGRQTL